MSNLLESLLSQMGGGEIEQMSSQLGVSSNQTKNAMASALPILMNALAKNSQNKQGASALDNALSKKHDGSILDNLGGFLSNPDLKDGSGILKHVLGAKRQNVEKYVSDDAGINSQSSGKLLEMLAPIVMGYLGKQKKAAPAQGGGIGDLLGSFLNQEKQASPKSQSVIEQLLDQDNDGSIADDITQLGASFLGRFLKR